MLEIKTVRFEVGDKVMLVSDNETLKGKIERLHIDLPRPIAIIALNDGSTRKAYVEDIVPDMSSECETDPKTTGDTNSDETGETSEITITPDDFKSVVAETVAQETSNSPEGRLLASIYISFAVKLHKMLFVGVEND